MAARVVQAVERKPIVQRVSHRSRIQLRSHVHRIQNAVLRHHTRRLPQRVIEKNPYNCSIHVNKPNTEVANHGLLHYRANPLSNLPNRSFAHYPNYSEIGHKLELRLVQFFAHSLCTLSTLAFLLRAKVIFPIVLARRLCTPKPFITQSEHWGEWTKRQIETEASEQER